MSESAGDANRVPSLTVESPFDRSVVAELPLDEGEALEAKVSRAAEVARAWRRVPLEERVAEVSRGVERFIAAGEETAHDVSRQMGKPLTQARKELETFRERAEYMLSIAHSVLAPDVLPTARGLHRRIEHEPLGVVLELAAWNYPVIIPVNVVVPALVAGNTVLIKHSARTPLAGAAFQRAFAAAIPGLVEHLVLTHEETARVLGDPRIAHVAFTGSVEGGRAVHRRLAGRFVDCGLELGGNDPAYVAPDADLDRAVEGIVDGACYNAGQSCCAVERVYVHRAVYREFVEAAVDVLERYTMGDPLSEDTTLGPLASHAALDELEAHVREAVDRGGRLVLGGQRVPASIGAFFPPTLLSDLRNDFVVMREETFGPIVPVMAVSSDEEALRLMDDTRYGLTASIWTRDLDRAEHFARELDVGTVYRDRCDWLDPALPWTGVRDSGRGSTLSRYGYYGLTRRKAICFRDDRSGR